VQFVNGFGIKIRQIFINLGEIYNAVFITDIKVKNKFSFLQICWLQRSTGGVLGKWPT